MVLNHGQRLRLRPEQISDFRPFELWIGAPLVRHSSKPVVVLLGVLDDVCCRERREDRHGVERGLRGCREHDGRAVVLAEIAQRVEHRIEQAVRERLGFIQDDHAVCQPVNLPALAAHVRKQALEELHGRGDDDRRVPILGGQPSPDRVLVEVFLILVSSCAPL